MTSDATEFDTFLTRHFGAGQIENGLSTRIGSLKMDSLQLLDLILAIEKNFGADLDVDAITDDMSLHDLHAKVLALRN